MHSKPTAEHEFLQQMVGEWTYESECSMGPDKPAEKFSGTETVRSIGGLWVIGEGRGKMPDGDDATMIITLGYDPATEKYVGTWLGSMMTRLWVYDITRVGNTLNMDAHGPSMEDSTKTAHYRDAIEIVSRDHRIFTGSVIGADGQRQIFMTAHYRRVS